MAEQKLDAIVREAIWVAYERKCVYTRELVDLASMHIDHILPELVVSSPIDFDALKASMGLPSDFNVYGLENVVVAKPGANLQKKDHLLNPAAAHFFLSLAARKKPEIEINIEKIKQRLESGRALVILQQLIDTGRVHVDHATRLLSGPREEIFKLADRLEFADNSAIGSISKLDLAELKKRPVRLGEGWGDGLELCRGREVVTVRTCEEYEKARMDGFEAPSNAHNKTSVVFEHQCGLLSALATATLPTLSYISNPRVGVCDLQLLPMALFPDLSNDRSEEENATSYADKVKDGELLVTGVGSGTLTIREAQGMAQHFVEIVRADFDGDGIEDILVFEYSGATHGTLGYGDVVLLSRRKPDQRFEFSRRDRVPSSGRW